MALTKAMRGSRPYASIPALAHGAVCWNAALLIIKPDPLYEYVPLNHVLYAPPMRDSTSPGVASARAASGSFWFVMSRWAQAVVPKINSEPTTRGLRIFFIGSGPA